MIFNESQGDLLKRYGIEAIEEHNKYFLEILRKAAVDLANQVGEITSDDLRLWANLNDVYPNHHNAWGAIFKSPTWTRVGFTKSKIPSNHSRIISIWRLS